VLLTADRPQVRDMADHFVSVWYYFFVERENRPCDGP
jgi:hypothetical protein